MAARIPCYMGTVTLLFELIAWISVAIPEVLEVVGIVSHRFPSFKFKIKVVLQLGLVIAYSFL